ncbi:PUA-like domain-containing protein [Immersiella caudata]|uniref:Thymocyte nuclear protein 1 n=1 Tax=Immersiella caudata TaxID=314043 RepID=A0AA39U5F2_9PEZI|nr:PUA-like domain-containing protein [Immersiella caudata]
MPKRKSTAVEETASEAPRRRSLRNVQPLSDVDQPAADVTPKPKAKGAGAPKAEKKTVAKRATQKTPQKVKEESEESTSPEPEPESEPESEPERPAKKSRASKQTPKAKATPKGKASPKAVGRATAKSAAKLSKSSAKAAATNEENAEDNGEKTYWLLKAEPESRIENGVDVKFSIDDLAAKKEPEPWDGIRAYAARNNLRAMKKGDLAFFYASNCKEPGIVGTMEIVQEHSPDLTAHDPKAAYYDPSSKPSDPKWSVVHVEFRSKFKVPIGLKELRAMGAPGQPLENMQMLKQTRLSVSKVTAAEWEYLTGVAEKKAAESK